MSSWPKPARNVAEPAADLTMRWLSSSGPSFQGERTADKSSPTPLQLSSCGLSWEGFDALASASSSAQATAGPETTCAAAAQAAAPAADPTNVRREILPSMYVPSPSCRVLGYDARRSFALHQCRRLHRGLATHNGVRREVRHSSSRCESRPNPAKSTRFRTSHLVWYGQHPGW